MVGTYKIGENEFIRISRDSQRHFLWNIKKLGEFKNQELHFVDLNGNEFPYDSDNIFQVLNVDDSLLEACNVLVLDLGRD